MIIESGNFDTKIIISNFLRSLIKTFVILSHNNLIKAKWIYLHHGTSLSC